MEKKPSSPTENLNFDAKDIEENKVIACLSYIGVLCLIPLLTKKESKYAQTHAKQGLALFIVDIVVSLVAWIPLFGWLLALGILIISIMGVVNALQGKFWKIPYVYDWSKKLNI